MGLQNGKSTVRATLVLPGRVVPVWLRDCLASLREADFVSLSVAVAECDQNATDRFSILDIWMRIEARIFRSKINKMEHSDDLVDITGELESVDPDGVDDIAISEIGALLKAKESEIVVWALPERPPAGALTIPKYGFLTIADAYNRALGMYEFVTRAPSTRCDIVRLGANASDDRIVASTHATTDDMLLVRGIHSLRVKCEALLLSTINRLARGADPRLDGLPQCAKTPVPRKEPGILLSMWGLMRLYGRYAVSLLSRRYFFDQWQLAYRVGGDRLDTSGLTRLAPKHQGFWADPFVAERDGRTFIFYEELSPETQRGHIAAIEINAEGETGEPVNVLVCDYHLSYPFMFEYEGELYMMPECEEAGRVEVFRCIRFPDQWESHKVLLEGVRGIDPTLVEHDGLWWLFVNVMTDRNLSWDELHLYYASSPFGDWQPHPLNPVRLDTRAARPGGAIYRENGKIFRPAQDCSVRYGWALSIHEITRLTTEEFSEVEVHRIPSDWAAGAHGTHTVNQACGITVYDCEARPRRKATN